MECFHNRLYSKHLMQMPISSSSKDTHREISDRARLMSKNRIFIVRKITVSKLK